MGDYLVCDPYYGEHCRYEAGDKQQQFQRVLPSFGKLFSVVVRLFLLPSLVWVLVSHFLSGYVSSVVVVVVA